ncbi:MAG: T9SS type A sorting domain-containing protein [Cyclobacteriaceae bacterium]|nr:T9SS type A sorting domain-containing protein [Cyclobacteriaceae bacterium HetDA_MAG_MS6]
MKKILAILLVSLPGLAISQPSAGEVLLVGYDADTDKGIAFVTLVDLPANTTIYFRDDEWNGSSFIDANEGTLSWSHTSIVASGSVIIIQSAESGSPTANTGTVTVDDSGFNPTGSNPGETIYVYLGSDASTPTTFLTAFSNNLFSNSGAITGTGLSAGINAFEIVGNLDVLVYSGSTTCNSTTAACAAQITNTGNWSSDDGGGDQSQDANNPDYPDDVPTSFSGSLLPVTWEGFNATAEQDKIILRWSTTQEINNDRFEIEWSADQKDFRMIGTVEGKGNYEGRSTYSLVTSSPFIDNYYRIRQVDFDGAFDYSKTILFRQESLKMKIYPNPAKDQFFIKSGGLPVKAQLEVYNLSGYQVMSQTLERGMYRHEVNLPDLQMGIYLLKISAKGAPTIHQKLIVD